MHVASYLISSWKSPTLNLLTPWDSVCFPTDFIAANCFCPACVLKRNQVNNKSQREFLLKAHRGNYLPCCLVNYKSFLLRKKGSSTVVHEHEQRIGVQVSTMQKGHCATIEVLPFSLEDAVLNLEI